jgi:hypothetical protein
MEARCSSETSVEIKRTTRRHIPEDDTLHKSFMSDELSAKLLVVRIGIMPIAEKYLSRFREKTSFII